MRRLLLALLVAAGASFLIGAGQQAPQRGLIASDADRAELDRISAYLNSVTTLKGSFIQIAPSGDVTDGTFYISKPGKIRFEYKPPSPNLIVSDGRMIAVANTRLNTVDRYPLSSTPFGIILGKEIDLRHSTSVVSVSREPDSFIVGARTSGNRNKANITFVFSEPELELRQWTVIDDQGQATTVALRGAESGVTLSSTLFDLPVPNAFSRRE